MLRALIVVLLVVCSAVPAGAHAAVDLLQPKSQLLAQVRNIFEEFSAGKPRLGKDKASRYAVAFTHYQGSRGFEEYEQYDEVLNDYFRPHGYPMHQWVEPVAPVGFELVNALHKALVAVPGASLRKSELREARERMVQLIERSRNIYTLLARAYDTVDGINTRYEAMLFYLHDLRTNEMLVFGGLDTE